VIGALVDGRYQLVERLGSGGTSSVWRAVDREDGFRSVAVKILHVARAGNAEALARFGREARTLERLSSPHVVTLRDHGIHEGRPFMVLDLVDGEDLGTLLRRRGRLSARLAVEIAEQIASGLAVAHAHGIVHRDLKPGNVLLARTGRVRLVDFGIARVLEEPGLTEAGRTVGTGDYMSPEQALGRAVDARSDLYSLGVLLFEMLAGRRPFAGSSCADVAAQHVRALPPSLAAHDAESPPALVALIDELLAKDPASRPAGADVLRSRLREIGAHLADAEETADAVHVVDAQSAFGSAGPAQSAPLQAQAGSGGRGGGRRRGRIRPERGATRRDAAGPGPGVSATGPSGDTAAWEQPPGVDDTFASGSDDEAPPLRSGRDRPGEPRVLRSTGATRRDAGPLRWVAVAALAVAVLLGGFVLAGAFDDDDDVAAGSSDAGAAAASAATTTPATSAGETAPATTGAQASSAPLRVTAVSTFDPDSDDGSERDIDAPKAIDGNAGTFWQSEIYRSSPEITGFKRGVGLIVQLERPTRVRGVRLSSPVPGYVAGVFTATGDEPPNALEDWRQAAAPRAIEAPRAVVRLARQPRARFLLVWITQLAPTPDANGGYSVSLSELQPLG
jgi:serine/threonine-protein kinase